MPNIDEHFSIQSIINIILSKLTMNPLIFIISGIIQHLIIDNIIEERPINVFNKSYKDYTSLILAILGVCIAFNSNTPLVFTIGLFASITPDIIEGLFYSLAGLFITLALLKRLIGKVINLDKVVWYRNKEEL